MWDLIVSVPDHCLSFHIGDMRCFLHLLVFQRILPIFSISFRNVRHFILLNALFLSIAIRLSDK